MNNYVLAVDGGGSKTALAVFNRNGEVIASEQGAGSSLSYDLQLSCERMMQQVASIMNTTAIPAHHTQCIIGVAGAGNPYNRAALLQRLKTFAFADTRVTSDAVTAALGANLGAPVACVALGTGSVGARLDSHGQLQLVGGWGFTLGDGGSGARLGAMAVQALMQAVDRQQPLHGLIATIAKDVGETRAEISAWVRQATAKEFATLSERVWPHANHCPIASEILARHKSAVLQLIADTRQDTELPVMLLGGLANKSKQLLSDSEQRIIMPARGNALDGAWVLATQNIQVE
ncbi:ATPase [Pseudoalteromonas sp. CNC9-20]|uniref:BadF/BadG/BcrA/BcrD ATPase family protein n=1 Tax=Pseudoalteromonas sp. CNC9-20 TaxID=2917750 RepID=UPI001EF5FF29|nr:BadF/BadG/BcrA/BcrD ATPase family protein [Pseudoalteromonas sp. CNC9-20]MCG7570809.1 ATPase [Pseudoalteromonas sp. CNC9-20]